jgi:cytidine deaminase
LLRFARNDKDCRMTDVDLVTLARAAALKAYAPYSGFSVGCAIESVDGTIVTGANMENACYRLGLCAEQSALTAAQHAFGLDKVARIAVAGGDGSGAELNGDAPVTPCGGCRQALLEASQLAGRDIEILCASGDGAEVEVHRLSALIPHGFGPANLTDSGDKLSVNDPQARTVLDMVKHWPGRPALVTWDTATGWSVGTPPEYLPPK